MIVRPSSIMLDWFRGEIEFTHPPIPSGRILSIEPDGTIEWESAKKIRVRESHETSLQIKSSGHIQRIGDYVYASHMMIDGNISKFLQGHNVFGSCDLNRLLYLAFEKIVAVYGEHFHGWSSPELALARIKKGNYLVKMIDINQAYDVGNDFNVEAWLHAAHMRAVSRHGRATRDKGTVYLGQHSRRWCLKFYNKWRELMARGGTHQLPMPLQNLGLEDFIKGKLRAELRLFGKELEEKFGITHGYHLTPDLINQLFNDYLGKIDMSAQVLLHDQQLDNMPSGLKGTYLHWKSGADVRSMMTRGDSLRPTPTFYRHRKALLEYGIDINAICPDVDNSNVVPMLRIIEAVPVAIPAWAYERGLIAA